MTKLLRVARYEYLRFIKRKSLLLAILGVPLLFVLIVAVGVLIARGGEEPAVGYVDPSGLLSPAVAATIGDDAARATRFRSYPSVEAGRGALRDGEIGALFAVPAEYPEDRSLRAFTAEGDLPAGAQSAFAAFLEAGLAARYPPAVADRLVRSPDVTVRAADGSREIDAGSAFLYFLVPFAAGILFTIAAVSSAGYLLQAVSDEKENRTVEILATSVSPPQLIAGKALGIIGVAATQLAVWGLGLVAAVVIGARYVEPLAQLSVPWSLLGVVLAFFVPAYLLLAAIMICLGSAFPEYRQSQQVVGLVNILFFVPLFFVSFIFADPNGPLAVALTLFPTTSFLTVLLRWSATTVPGWQLALAWVLLAATGAVFVWAAPRIFRAGMLRYGQRLSLAASWRTLRAGRRGD